MKKRRGGAGPAARSAPAAAAPQLPERQETPAPPGQGPGPGRRRRGPEAAPAPARSPIPGGVVEVTAPGPPTREAPRPGWGARTRTKTITCGELGECRKMPEARSRLPPLCLRLSGSEEEMGRPAPPAPPALPSTSLRRALPGASRCSPAFPVLDLERALDQRAWRCQAWTPNRTSCSPPLTPELLNSRPLVI